MPLTRIKERLTRRQAFKALIGTCGLKLDYELNRGGYEVLREIFVKRAYADYFPFYQPVTIVDVGAHYGYFSLFANANTTSGTEIIAVEPAAENVRILKQNMQLNDLQNVRVVEGALSGEEGEIELYTAKSDNYSLFDSEANKLSSNKAVRVEAVTLAHIMQRHDIQSIDFLKMDCEGAEYPVLMEAPTSVLDRIQTISLEFHDVQSEDYNSFKLLRFLKASGFSIVKFAHEPTNHNLNYGKLIATKL